MISLLPNLPKTQRGERQGTHDRQRKKPHLPEAGDLPGQVGGSPGLLGLG